MVLNTLGNWVKTGSNFAKNVGRIFIENTCLSVRRIISFLDSRSMIYPEFAPTKNGLLLHQDNSRRIKQWLLLQKPCICSPIVRTSLTVPLFFFKIRKEGIEDIQTTAMLLFRKITSEKFLGYFLSWKRRWRSYVRIREIYCKSL